MELSIDSSTRYATVALSDRGAVVDGRTWRADRNHSVELAPAARESLERAGVGPRDLDAVFVARGPGGFTSLRVGVALAKTLSMGLGVPLVGVGTMEIEMAPHLPADRPVCAIIEAGGGRLYAAWSDGEREVVTVVTVEELAERTEAGTLFCGEAAAAVAPRLTELLGGLASFAGGEPPTRSADAMAGLAWRRLEAGGAVGPDDLEPLYMRSAQYSVAARTHLG